MSSEIDINFRIFEEEGEKYWTLTFLHESGSVKLKFVIGRPYIYTFSDWKRIIYSKFKMSFDFEDSVKLENDGENFILKVDEDMTINSLEIKISLPLILEKLDPIINEAKEKGCKFEYEPTESDYQQIEEGRDVNFYEVNKESIKIFKDEE